MTEPTAEPRPLTDLIGLDPNLTEGLPAADHVEILRQDHPDQEAYESVYEVIRQHPPRSTDSYGIAAENARVWRAVQAALDVQRAERDRLAAQIAAVQEIHRPIRIYGECGHDHDPDGADVQYIAEVGYVCDAGYLYTICAECCTDGEERTEPCVDYHEHQGRSQPCLTLATLDTTQDGDTHA